MHVIDYNPSECTWETNKRSLVSKNLIGRKVQFELYDVLNIGLTNTAYTRV